MSVFFPLSNLAVTAICGHPLWVVSVYIEDVSVGLHDGALDEVGVLDVDLGLQLLVLPDELYDGYGRGEPHPRQQHHEHTAHVVQTQLVGRLLGVILRGNIISTQFI